MKEVFTAHVMESPLLPGGYVVAIRVGDVWIATAGDLNGAQTLIGPLNRIIEDWESRSPKHYIEIS